uniref:Uncharacterized protein n=1 Tax=Anopheles atroparvus TaxID=41427 RepID=A0A182ITJ2_ANOAO
MTPPPAMVALISLSSSSSPRMASCKWRGVIRFSFRSWAALPANSSTSAELADPGDVERHLCVTVGKVASAVVPDEVGHSDQLSVVYRGTTGVPVARPMVSGLVEADETGVVEVHY